MPLLWSVLLPPLWISSLAIMKCLCGASYCCLVVYCPPNRIYIAYAIFSLVLIFCSSLLAVVIGFFRRSLLLDVTCVRLFWFLLFNLRVCVCIFIMCRMLTSFALFTVLMLCLWLIASVCHLQVRPFDVFSVIQNLNLILFLTYLCLRSYRCLSAPHHLRVR